MTRSPCASTRCTSKVERQLLGLFVGGPVPAVLDHLRAYVGGPTSRSPCAMTSSSGAFESARSRARAARSKAPCPWHWPPRSRRSAVRLEAGLQLSGIAVGRRVHLDVRVRSDRARREDPLAAPSVCSRRSRSCSGPRSDEGRRDARAARARPARPHDRDRALPVRDTSRAAPSPSPSPSRQPARSSRPSTTRRRRRSSTGCPGASAEAEAAPAQPLLSTPLRSRSCHPRTRWLACRRREPRSARVRERARFARHAPRDRTVGGRRRHAPSPVSRRRSRRARS